MAKEISWSSSTGLNFYAVVEQAGTFWNGSAMEAFNASNWGNYDIDLTEIGVIGIYQADFPALSAGKYRVHVYQRAGASPATTDVCVASGEIAWSGTAEIALSSTLAANVTQWLGTALATPDTPGYPKATIKDGSGAGELNLTNGAIDQVNGLSATALAQFFTVDSGVTDGDAVAGSVVKETADKVWNSTNTGWFVGTMGEAVLGYTTQLNSILTKLFGITSLANWLRAMARKSNTNATAVSEINADIGAGAGTFDPTTDSEEAIKDSALTAAQVNAEADAALSDVGLTTTVTGRIDAAISTRSTLTSAQVNAEADQALADYDPPTKTEMDAGFDALNNISASAVVTAIKADTEWKTILANAEGDWTLTLPGSFPGSGTLVLKSKDGLTTFVTFTLTFNADGVVTQRAAA